MQVEDQEPRTFVCFSCAQPNEFENRFCKFCNAPISQYSSNDPLQIAYGEGMAYRKAVEGRPKLVIVLGIWLLFFPLLIGSGIVLTEIIYSGNGSIAFVIFWLSILTAGFSLVMLYRVTKNYFKFDEKRNRNKVS